MTDAQAAIVRHALKTYNVYHGLVEKGFGLTTEKEAELRRLYAADPDTLNTLLDLVEQSDRDAQRIGIKSKAASPVSLADAVCNTRDSRPKKRGAFADTMMNAFKDAFKRM